LRIDLQFPSFRLLDDLDEPPVRPRRQAGLPAFARDEAVQKLYSVRRPFIMFRPIDGRCSAEPRRWGAQPVLVTSRCGGLAITGDNDGGLLAYRAVTPP
jgi:hypothetical protein